MEQYVISQGAERIGTVDMVKDGLYYVIRCHCRLSGEVMYDLIMHCAGTSRVLGLLVPEGNLFSIQKKLSVREAGEGPFSFSVKPRHQKMKGILWPVKEGSPFAYLSQLEQAYLVRRGAEMLLCLPEENNAKNREINA